MWDTEIRAGDGTAHRRAPPHVIREVAVQAVRTRDVGTQLLGAFCALVELEIRCGVWHATGLVAIRRGRTSTEAGLTLDGALFEALLLFPWVGERS